MYMVMHFVYLEVSNLTKLLPGSRCEPKVVFKCKLSPDEESRLKTFGMDLDYVIAR